MKFSNMIKEARTKSVFLIGFFKHDLWKIRLEDLPKPRRRLYRFLRIMVVTLTGIQRDEIHLRASALTFLTMLSVVPLLAMAFGIATGFGLKETLQQEILNIFEGQEEVISQSIGYAQSMLENTQGGVVAGFGFGLLLWTVLKLLINVEASFNQIWHVQNPRTYLRKVTDYLSIMFIAPILMVAANSASVLIITAIKQMAENVELLSWASSFIMQLFRLIPFILFSALFTSIYLIMPNTNVKPASAIIAGVFSGMVYQLTQWLFIDLQIGVSRYNAIYGSFSALPLFLLWVLASWWIILIGSKLAYAHQNIDRYEFGWNTIKPSESFRKFLAILVTRQVVDAFRLGRRPPTVQEIAASLGTPWTFVSEITNTLARLGLLNEVNLPGSEDTGFHPGKDIHHITVAYLLEAMEREGDDDIAVTDAPIAEHVREKLFQLRQTIMDAQANVPVKDI